MSDELLNYYSRELTYIRTMAAEFAEAHPAVAGQLGLSSSLNEAKDPHVERMIEAFAYLTARIRHKLDDGFPEIVSGLLSVLYPHYQAPIPSMSILQFVLDPSQAGNTAGYLIPKGAPLEAEAPGGECRYSTCYPVHLLPIEVESARLQNLPFPPSGTQPAGAVVAARIAIRCMAPDMELSKLPLKTLRFFLSGPIHHALAFYELLFNNSVEVKIAPQDAKPDSYTALLGVSSLRPVGFAQDENALPFTPRSFPGYRLLSEYFTFLPKFLFFDIVIPPDVPPNLGNSVEISIFLNRTDTDLERAVNTDFFRLGCSPIVNLFSQTAEPIRLSNTHSEYMVIPDVRKPLAREVYSIESAIATSPAEKTVEFAPFYSCVHGLAPKESRGFWHAQRRTRQLVNGQIDRGTDVYISLVDLNFSPVAPSDWTMVVKTTCLNRDLPATLPFGGGQPVFHLTEGGPVSVACLARPSPTFRNDLRGAALWRLVSHLSLNHLSLSGGTQGAEALREILQLYNLAGSADTNARIASVLEINARAVTARAGGGICRGVEINVLFDEQGFPDRGLFLFASVLERFFALYCTVNSFTQMVATAKQREGVIRRWPPRAGEQFLV